MTRAPRSRRSRRSPSPSPNLSPNLSPNPRPNPRSNPRPTPNPSPRRPRALGGPGQSPALGGRWTTCASLSSAPPGTDSSLSALTSRRLLSSRQPLLLESWSLSSLPTFRHPGDARRVGELAGDWKEASAASPWGTVLPLAPPATPDSLASQPAPRQAQTFVFIPTPQFLQPSGCWGSLPSHWLPEPGQGSW